MGTCHLIQEAPKKEKKKGKNREPPMQFAISFKQAYSAGHRIGEAGSDWAGRAIEDSEKITFRAAVREMKRTTPNDRMGRLI